jgi:hypothetical protein
VLDVEDYDEVPLPLDVLFANCRELRKLHSLLVLSLHSLTDVSLMHIGQLTTLRRLHLVHATMSEHGLHALAGLSELEVLELPSFACTRPTGFMKTLQALVQVLPKLQVLDVSEKHVDAMPDSANFKRFHRDLKLHEDDPLTDDDVEFVKCISGFNGLLHVSIHGCTVTLKEAGRQLLQTLQPGSPCRLNLDYKFRPYTYPMDCIYKPYYQGGGGYEDGNGTRPIFLENGEEKSMVLFLRWREQKRGRQILEARRQKEARRNVIT